MAAKSIARRAVLDFRAPLTKTFNMQRPILSALINQRIRVIFVKSKGRAGRQYFGYK